MNWYKKKSLEEQDYFTNGISICFLLYKNWIIFNIRYYSIQTAKNAGFYKNSQHMESMFVSIIFNLEVIGLRNNFIVF